MLANVALLLALAAAPSAFHVTHNRVDMTRLLCAYRQIAQFKGVGSTDDAANFVCKPQSGN
jgi:hypothetical protein